MKLLQQAYAESIKHSDGGVSELLAPEPFRFVRVYQAFRWWGVGTFVGMFKQAFMSLSSIPMVGCRNGRWMLQLTGAESIKHSDGGVSEPMM